MPWIVRNGGDAFLALGRPNNGGTKLFSVTGHVERPGNYEVKLGTPFAKLLEMAGGMRGGSKLKAVIPGGSSMPVLPADIMMQTDMDYDSIAKAGLDARLGRGDRDGRDAPAWCARWSACRTSTSRSPAASARPAARAPAGCTAWCIASRTGRGRMEDLALLDNVADNIAGRTICALGDAAALPVKSFIKHFRDEFEHHIEHKQCLVQGADRAQVGPQRALHTSPRREGGRLGDAQARDRRPGSRGRRTAPP